MVAPAGSISGIYGGYAVTYVKGEYQAKTNVCMDPMNSQKEDSTIMWDLLTVSYPCIQAGFSSQERALDAATIPLTDLCTEVEEQFFAQIGCSNDGRTIQCHVNTSDGIGEASINDFVISLYSQASLNARESDIFLYTNDQREVLTSAGFLQKADAVVSMLPQNSEAREAANSIALHMRALLAEYGEK
ncbi:MAG: hypothetical protein NT099_04845 [Candidatus Saganbacteria bacterium]|nr:hypothetical protein [Candidatus Saganbacteria bacterium]